MGDKSAAETSPASIDPPTGTLSPDQVHTRRQLRRELCAGREREQGSKSVTQNAKRDDCVMQQRVRDAELYLKRS